MSAPDVYDSYTAADLLENFPAPPPWSPERAAAEKAAEQREWALIEAEAREDHKRNPPPPLPPRELLRLVANSNKRAALAALWRLRYIETGERPDLIEPHNLAHTIQDLLDNLQYLGETAAAFAAELERLTAGLLVPAEYAASLRRIEAQLAWQQRGKSSAARNGPGSGWLKGRNGLAGSSWLKGRAAQ